MRRRRRTAPPDPRVQALRRFAFSITAFTIAGAFGLGFEDSWAQPVVSLVCAYTFDLGLETLAAWGEGRTARYRGGVRPLFEFLLPAHISGLSVALLLYPGDRLAPIVFATAVMTASKYVLRVSVGGRPRHFLNPSNIGIVATLIAFPSVGISPPYQFTENVAGAWDWVLPVAVLAGGTMLNAGLTRKLPLILGWVGGFALQAALRAAFFDGTLVAALLPMTGLVFVIFTNYMITDPGTTPVRPRNQLAFGAAIALAYGGLVVAHVVFGFFFAVTIVSAARGAYLFAVAREWTRVRESQPAAAARPTVS
jgi:hypothetical protein